MGTELEIISLNLPKRIERVKALVLTSGREADNSLVEIASKEGDEAALQVVKGLTDVERMLVIKGTDLTHNPYLVSILTPKEIMGIIEAEVRIWKNVIKKEGARGYVIDGAHLEEFIENATDFTLTVLLSIDTPQKFAETITEISQSEKAFHLLLLVFPHEKELNYGREDVFVEYLPNFDNGSPEELFHRIKENNPCIFDKLVKEAEALSKTAKRSLLRVINTKNRHVSYEDDGMDEEYEDEDKSEIMRLNILASIAEIITREGLEMEMFG